VWSGAADLCRLQWNAATECNIILPLAAFPLHRCPAALCNSILLFNSKRSIAKSSRPRRRGDSGRSNSSKVRFARDPEVWVLSVWLECSVSDLAIIQQLKKRRNAATLNFSLRTIRKLEPLRVFQMWIFQQSM
jgi:hypothetical protein